MSLYLDQRLVAVDGLVFGGEQAGYAAVERAFDAYFHLHRFQQQQRLTFLNRVAGLHQHGAHLGRHGRAHVFAAVMVGWASLAARDWPAEAEGAAAHGYPCVGAVDRPVEGDAVAIDPQGELAGLLVEDFDGVGLAVQDGSQPVGVAVEGEGVIYAVGGKLRLLWVPLLIGPLNYCGKANREGAKSAHRPDVPAGKKTRREPKSSLSKLRVSFAFFAPSRFGLFE